MHPIRRRLAVAASLLLAAAATPALAHHTAAMFDKSKTVTLNGTVRLFQWSSPHGWIQLVVDGEGGPAEWTIEMGAPIELYRVGWKPGSLKPGDKIALAANPTHDGSRAALFVSAVRQDGSAIGTAK